MNAVTKQYFYRDSETHYFPTELIEGNIFFSGDIVEVLNISSKQDYNIKSQTCDFTQNTNRVIGNRYVLDVTKYQEVISHGRYLGFDEFQEYANKLENNKVTLWHRLKGWSNGGHSGDKFQPEQLMLYKRPFKNRLKYLWLKVTNIYIS